MLVIVLTPEKSAELLCRLAEEELIYPAFTAILVDKWKVLNFESEGQCNKTLVMKAAHGHIHVYPRVPRLLTTIKKTPPFWCQSQLRAL